MHCMLRSLAAFSRATRLIRQVSTVIEPTRWVSGRQPERERYLITGGLGQLGSELTRLLRRTHGQQMVITSDIVRPPHFLEHSPYLYVDVLDMDALRSIIVNENVTCVIHLAALLSATAERNLPQALKINVDGMHNVLEAARVYDLKVFLPSTIGAFGPSSPRHKTPDITIQRPTSVYGVTKVYAEILGEYYHQKFGVDFRCVRLPGVISTHEPGGGTTDYAVQIFYDAFNGNTHECYLSEDTELPMIYIDDCLNGIIKYLETPEEKLKIRTYNITGMSFSPKIIYEAIKKHKPDFRIKYDICPVRQAIANSWPASLDDSNARKDWGWKAEYDIDKMVTTMLKLLKENAETVDSKNIFDSNEPVRQFPAEYLLSKPTA